MPRRPCRRRPTTTITNTINKAVFVRHGQSVANLGRRCPDIALIELTALGHEQAEVLAKGWTAAPDLIVVSPFLRTQQTAAPTIARFPDVPVETWPVQEFTCLEPSRWHDSLVQERLPTLTRYWAASDPAYRDGPGAESFSDLLDRARTALARLAAMGDGALTFIFSHAQFIQAVLALVEQPSLSDHDHMATFWKLGAPDVIANAESRALIWDGADWATTPS